MFDFLKNTTPPKQETEINGVVVFYKQHCSFSTNAINTIKMLHSEGRIKLPPVFTLCDTLEDFYNSDIYKLTSSQIKNHKTFPLIFFANDSLQYTFIGGKDELYDILGIASSQVKYSSRRK